MFIVDDIINGIFSTIQKGMELGKPGPAQTPIDVSKSPGNFASFAQATGAEPRNSPPSEGQSNYVEQTRAEMKETTPAASVGGAPVNAGAAVSDMIGPLPGQQPYGANMGAVGPLPSQAGSYQAQIPPGLDMASVPNDPTLLAKTNERQAYEDAKSAQAGDAAMDMALGLGQDIFSMSQQLGKPGPTGSIQMPKGPGQNPRLSALLGQLYRG